MKEYRISAVITLAIFIVFFAASLSAELWPAFPHQAFVINSLVCVFSSGLLIFITSLISYLVAKRQNFIRLHLSLYLLNLTLGILTYLLGEEGKDAEESEVRNPPVEALQQIEDQLGSVLETVGSTSLIFRHSRYAAVLRGILMDCQALLRLVGPIPFLYKSLAGSSKGPTELRKRERALTSFLTDYNGRPFSDAIAAHVTAIEKLYRLDWLGSRLRGAVRSARRPEDGPAPASETRIEK